mgnify:CR=1 FL=1
MGVDWNDKFNYLLNNGLVEQISDKKININNKNRIYNPNKLSKVLTKAVDSLYKKQYPKKPKRRFRNVKEIPAGSADVLLQFDDDGYVKQDRFLEFINRYEQIEAKKQNPQEVELKYIIETETITEDDIVIEVSEEFVKQKTAYGGDEGLKLYLKKTTAEMIWKKEDSGVTVKRIFISNIYVSKRNTQIPTKFRQIRMYGTLYNYNGYG